MRKAHWAIDKVTRDLGERFSTHTSISAVMELVNEIYKERESADPSHVRFALVIAGSLIFPFAPHLGSEVYEALTGGRVWEQPWPEANPATARGRYLPADRATQRQADRPPGGAGGHGALRAGAAGTRLGAARWLAWTAWRS